MSDHNTVWFSSLNPLFLCIPVRVVFAFTSFASLVPGWPDVVRGLFHTFVRCLRGCGCVRANTVLLHPAECSHQGHTRRETTYLLRRRELERPGAPTLPVPSVSPLQYPPGAAVKVRVRPHPVEGHGGLRVLLPLFCHAGCPRSGRSRGACATTCVASWRCRKQRPQLSLPPLRSHVLARRVPKSVRGASPCGLEYPFFVASRTLGGGGSCSSRRFHAFAKDPACVCKQKDSRRARNTRGELSKCVCFSGLFPFSLFSFDLLFVVVPTPPPPRLAQRNEPNSGERSLYSIFFLGEKASAGTCSPYSPKWGRS